MISILFTLRDGVDSVAVVSKILGAVASSTENKPRLRLRILVSVFNLVSLTASRVEAITSAIYYFGDPAVHFAHSLHLFRNI
jgi:hypothetical protein